MFGVSEEQPGARVATEQRAGRKREVDREKALQGRSVECIPSEMKTTGVF